jgi:hypothetical protein
MSVSRTRSSYQNGKFRSIGGQHCVRQAAFSGPAIHGLRACQRVSPSIRVSESWRKFRKGGDPTPYEAAARCLLLQNA